MSSYDNETLNVGLLGFPGNGSIGVNSSGNLITNNSSGSISSIYLTFLNSLTTGTFVNGTQYTMTAVFSKKLLALPTIIPPNTTDIISSVSYSSNTLTFLWTPQDVCTNVPFQFQINDIWIISGNYTISMAPATLTFIPSGISQSSGNIVSWTDTTSVASYTVNTGVPTYDSTNNCVNLGSGQCLSTSYNANLTLLVSFAIKFYLNSISSDFVMFGNNLGFYVNSTTLVLCHQDSASYSSIGTLSASTWYILIVSYNGTTINYSLNNTQNSCSNVNEYTGTLPNLGNHGTGTNCKIKEVMFWNNHVLSSKEMTSVYNYLTGTGM